MTEQENTTWRNNIIQKDIEDGVWYTHPVHKHYEANTNGELRNKTTQKIINGSSNKNGRTTVSINKMKKQKHRIILECLYGILISDSFEVDHKDKNPANNVFSNLQILTIKEHAEKTAATCSERGKKAGLHFAIQIIRKKGEIEESFASIAEAVSKLNIDKKRIHRSIRFNVPDSDGYQWSKISQKTENIPGEVWKELPSIQEKLFVSTKGRVRLDYLKSAIPKLGSLTEENYRLISIKGKQYKIHKLVALAFLGPQPSPSHTVDHIDKNNQNNCVENLRWATQKEQANNRSTVRKVEVYNILTQEILKIYSSQQEVSQEYNVKESVVSLALQFSTKETKRGYTLGSHKYVSVRFHDLNKNEKMERELYILKHDLDVLQRDLNKRKTNPENLPIHITKSKSTYILTMTFRGEKKRLCSSDIESLIQTKKEWIASWEQEYTKLIRNTFN